jgi:hypothetical protein
MGRKIHPYQQGSLDSLCGPYAIINSLRALGKVRTNSEAEEVFKKILVELERKYPLSELLTDGVDIAKIDLVLDRVVAAEYSVCVSRPFASQLKDYNFQAIVDALSIFLKEKRGIVFFSLDGHFNHWSLINRVTKSSFLLFDSDEGRRLSFKNTHIEVTKPLGSKRVHYVDPFYFRFLWTE